jgi:hypothetical protein
MKALRRLIVIFLALFWTLHSMLALDDRLVLKISSDKKIYYLGEPVLIEVRFLNMSNDNIKFVWPPELKSIGYVRNELSEEAKNNKNAMKAPDKGKKHIDIPAVEAGGVFFDGTNPGDEKLIELEEHELVGHVIELSKIISLERNGRYYITLEYALGEYHYPGKSLYQQLTAPEYKSIYQGNLVSNEIRIEIVDNAH